MNGISAFLKSVERQLDLFLPCEDAISGVYNLEGGPHENLTMLEPLSWTLRFQNCEKYMFIF